MPPKWRAGQPLRTDTRCHPTVLPLPFAIVALAALCAKARFPEKLPGSGSLVGGLRKPPYEATAQVFRLVGSHSLGSHFCK